MSVFNFPLLRGQEPWFSKAVKVMIKYLKFCIAKCGIQKSNSVRGTDIVLNCLRWRICTLVDFIGKLKIKSLDYSLASLLNWVKRFKEAVDCIYFYISFRLCLRHVCVVFWYVSKTEVLAKKMEKQSVISPILIWVMKNSKRKETDGHVAIEKFMIIDQNI